MVSVGAEGRQGKPTQADTRLVRLVRGKNDSLRDTKWFSGCGEPEGGGSDPAQADAELRRPMSGKNKPQDQMM